jgi:hypothetical protein
MLGACLLLLRVKLNKHAKDKRVEKNCTLKRNSKVKSQQKDLHLNSTNLRQ